MSGGVPPFCGDRSCVLDFDFLELDEWTEKDRKSTLVMAALG